ncbi:MULTISPECIES: YbaY family lipoprotein [Aquitalea]|uniref:YbaY family lipoprotein n=1 Tax=Aquitalea TaxID=407217 RepID=UPI001315AC79|nr:MULTISPECIES: YbaY family lipoprotein [Aquitalea]
MMGRSTRRSLLAAGLLAVLAGCASHGYQPQYLNGSVVLKAPSLKLPLATTLVRVRLLDDNGQADAPARLLAEQTLEKPKAFPLAFSLCYDKHAIQSGGSYSLQAQVYVDGELRLQNTSRVNAFSSGMPQLQVELIK